MSLLSGLLLFLLSKTRPTDGKVPSAYNLRYKGVAVSTGAEKHAAVFSIL